MQSLVFYFIMFALLLACTGNLVPRAVDLGKFQKIMPSTYRPFVASLSVALVSSTIKCKISEDEYDFWFPMGVLYWTRIKHQLRLWTLLYTRTLRWHTHTHKKRDGKQIESKSVSIRGEYSRGESHFSLFWKDFYFKYTAVSRKVVG